MTSELGVCQSAAGYYLGREDYDGAPYSRQSRYFRTKEDALIALALYPATRRDCIENAMLYMIENNMTDPTRPIESYDPETDYDDDDEFQQ